MQIVPLQAHPNQTLQIQLTNQNCLINVYQKFFGLFMDLFVSNVPIVQGVLCENANYIVRSLYLNFQGDFVFWDNQPNGVLGPQDPQYTGLGARWSLVYLEPDDLPADYGLSS